MPQATTPPQRTVHAVLGATLVALAINLDRILAIPPSWGRAQTAGVVLGVAVALAGFALPRAPHRAGRLGALSTKLALAALTVLAAVGAAEIGLRAAGHDFAQQERAHLAIPPYFRESTEPLGDVFFRRPGPQQWVGQVLNVRLDQIGVQPNPFADEASVTIDYDAGGFRNPGELSDWQLAVVGDSFTELGYLPHEDLFTTLLGENLGVSVKNLGVSETGNLSHVTYYTEYGDAPSTEDVLLVFFEGNDPLETAVERRNQLVFERGGERPRREFERQSSLLRSLYARLEDSGRSTEAKVHRLDHARFTGSGQGADEPLTLFFAPRHPSEITDQLIEHYAAREVDFGPEHHADADVEAAMDLAFARFAAVAGERGVRPWLAFMPCKARVHHGQFEFTERASENVRNWTPTDFSAYVQALAEKHGIRFIDLTPALVTEAQATGSLLFNTMYDCHLNRRGSHAVAEALTEALRGRLGR